MAALRSISIEEGARGMVRNTIKHAGPRKVAVAEGKSRSSVRRPYGRRLFA